MKTVFTLAGAKVLVGDQLVKTNVIIAGEWIVALSEKTKGRVVHLTEDHIIAPAFVDLHTHLRDPAFHAFTGMNQESQAAYYGGYQLICAMPNTQPVIDDLQKFWIQNKTKRKKKKAPIEIMDYCAITLNQAGVELVNMEILASFVRLFSDDGKGVDNLELLGRFFSFLEADKHVVAMHLQEMEATKDRVVIQAEKGACFGYQGLTNQHESAQLAKHLKLLEKYPHVNYHAAHVSTAESVALIKQAQQANLKVTAEVTPHHLLLNCDNIPTDSGLYKVNPPLRSQKDQKAVLEALQAKVITCIATDHAPHPWKDKQKSFSEAKPGFIGLDIMFPLLYTNLVLKNKLNLATLLHATSINPARLLQRSVAIEKGNYANLVVIDTKNYYEVKKENLHSACVNTPFYHYNLTGWPVMNIYHGYVKRLKRFPKVKKAVKSHNDKAKD